MKDAAHGGSGWSPRIKSLRQELGNVWETCGVSNEWSSLEAVLMHRPGQELEQITNANAALMHAVPELAIARSQHNALAQAYKAAGVIVYYVDPPAVPPPNQMYVADLFFMTPEGAILARPASTVRAGEERFTAARLASIGVPILRCVRGNGVFEGADALWLDSDTVLLGTGLRTNHEGATQVESLLKEMEVDVSRVELAEPVMHLMGTLRFVDQELAIGWRKRLSKSTLKVLRQHGYTMFFIPNEQEAERGMALNFVTLGPEKIMMPAGNPTTQAFYEDIGVECVTVDMNEIHKAAGGIGCLTGILKRSRGRKSR